MVVKPNDTLDVVRAYILSQYAQYPSSALANERAALNKAPLYYGVASLRDIPADPNAYLKKWGRGKVRLCPPGFENITQYRNWRKHAKSALTRYWKHVHPVGKSNVSLLPDWKRLIDYVKANGGFDQPLPLHLDKSIGAIGRAASASGLRIADLVTANTQTLINDLKGSAKRSAKLGVERINDLIGRRNEFVEIAPLLPQEKITILKKLPHPSDKYLRKSRDPLAKRLWLDYERFVLAKRGTDSLGRSKPPEFTKFGKRTERTYANVIQQVIRVLINFGHLHGNEALSLRDICNGPMIKTFASAWNTRQIMGEVKASGHNLYSMLNKLKVMTAHLGANEDEINEIRADLKKVKDTYPEMDQMTRERQEWLRNFLKDEVLQAKLFGSPELMQKHAQKILNNWDKSPKHQRMLAIKLGLTACTNAILYRASPVRAENLINLKYRGDDKNVITKNNDLRIKISGNRVKNRKPIDHDADDDAAPIVQWYIEQIRPKLIDEHPYGAKLSDSDYLFPSKRPDRPLEATTFADHYREGCGVIGLDITLHLARHVTATIILDENPNAWAQAARVLGDEEATVRKFYAFLDAQKASDAGRAMVKERRKRVLGYKKGRHDD